MNFVRTIFITNAIKYFLANLQPKWLRSSTIVAGCSNGFLLLQKQNGYNAAMSNIAKICFRCRNDVEPTNNVAERALHPSVIHRKVTGCFRSEWGAKAFAVLTSIIDTAELSGERAFDAIQSLFDSSSLSILLQGEYIPAMQSNTFWNL